LSKGRRRRRRRRWWWWWCSLLLLLLLLLRLGLFGQGETEGLGAAEFLRNCFVAGCGFGLVAPSCFDLVQLDDFEAGFVFFGVLVVVLREEGGRGASGG